MMKQKNNNIKRFGTLMVIVGIIACLGVGFLGYSVLVRKGVIPAQSTANNAPVNADIALEGSDETVVEPHTLDSYKVAADAPRILKINSLNLAAKVRPMGVNSLGAVQAPVNIHDAGWYTGSAKPGAYGAMFVDAHASGATRQGLFAYLDTLKNGDTVTIEKGDGAVLTYKVVHVETVSKDAVDMNKALQVYGGAKEGLNLMTCTGKWINNEKTYDKRAVVYTERVS